LDEEKKMPRLGKALNLEPSLSSTYYVAPFEILSAPRKAWMEQKEKNQALTRL
jgi:hypothetical protein